MLKAVLAVRDEVLKRADGNEVDLQLIDRVVRERTFVDEITYVRFNAGPNNPIWGEFQRWTKSPSVYAAAETIVEIRYAYHLDQALRKFVVTKELCHALEAPTGSHDVTSVAVDSVVLSFSFLSNAAALKEIAPAFASEIMAEICALEILFPLETRKKILAENPIPDVLKLSEDFNLPMKYMNRALNPNYMAFIEDLLKDP